MPAPRFLDTVDASDTILRQAAGGATMPPASIFGGNQSSWLDSGTKKKLASIEHFTYWNYVAITRITDRVSSLFPNVGYEAAAGKDVKSQLTLGQKAHLQRHYGRVIQSASDLTPVPQSHPFLSLLKSVNPKYTWQELVERTFVDRLLTGEFYWWLIPSKIMLPTGHKMPVQIWHLPITWIGGWNYDDNGNRVSLKVYAGGRQARLMEIPAEEIADYVSPNPFNPGNGYSAIESSPFWTLNAEEIEKSRFFTFKNRINPDHLVIMENDAQLVQNGINIVEMIQETLLQRYARAANFRKPLVAPPGVKDVKELGVAPKEMDFGSSSGQTRDCVLALHGVPKVIAGITDDVNRATVEGANVVFCENTLNPHLGKFSGFLTENVAVRFDPRLRAWYDDCAPHSAEQELREAQADFAMGAKSPNERRVERGMQPIKEAAYESCYLQSSVVPLSEEVKEANMERALEIAGNRADPEEDDGDTPPKKGEDEEDDPKAKPTADEDDEEKKPKKKQSIDTLPGLDNL